MSHNNGVLQDPVRGPQLHDMRRAGFTLAEIGQALNISAERVRQCSRGIYPEFYTVWRLAVMYNVGADKLKRALVDNEVQPIAYRGSANRPLYKREDVEPVIEHLKRR